MTVEPAIEVTTHGDLRARKRLGLPRRAVHRQAEAALRFGFRPTHYAGALRAYLDHRLTLEDSSQAPIDVRVFGEFIYIFAAGPEGPRLITVYRLPRSLLGAVRAQASNRLKRLFQSHEELAHDLGRNGP